MISFDNCGSESSNIASKSSSGSAAPRRCESLGPLHVKHPHLVRHSHDCPLMGRQDGRLPSLRESGDQVSQRLQLEGDAARVRFVGQQQIEHGGELEIREIPRPIRHDAVGRLEHRFQELRELRDVDEARAGAGRSFAAPAPSVDRCGGNEYEIGSRHALDREPLDRRKIDDRRVAEMQQVARVGLPLGDERNC